MLANTMICLEMSKCQFYIGITNVIQIEIHLHVESQTYLISLIITEMTIHCFVDSMNFSQDECM